MPAAVVYELSSALVLQLLAAAGSAILLFLNAFTVNAAWWTVRLHVFRREHIYWGAIALSLTGSLALGTIYNTLSLWSVGLTAIVLAGIVHVALGPAWTDAEFRETFWRAWTGRSRTRIQTALAPALAASSSDVANAAKKALLGGPERWITLEMNPGIAADSTAVLRVLIAQDPTAKAVIPYGSDCAVGYVFPSLADLPSNGNNDLSGTSLLWGVPTFRRRVSRAIGAMDSDLWARIARGGSASHVLAWAALAHGVLGRNKGLNPSALSCIGLGMKFELASNLGPRPAKTKRGLVMTHMRAVYGLLGDDYVQLAVELALLLEDSGAERVCAWLGAECEHQDPVIARTVPSAFGGVLYRLHYIAMLASLNFGGAEAYVRPELLVLKYLGPKIFLDAHSHGGWGWLEKYADRLDVERKANPGCEAWLQDVSGA